MFGNFFSGKEYQSKTGVFKVIGDGLIEIEEIQGEGSINDYIVSIGYPINHIYTVFCFDSEHFETLCFTALTKELKLVFTKNKNLKITMSDVKKAIKSIDWKTEYSTLNIEDFLNEGIEYGNLSINFLQSISDLKQEDGNLYKSDKLGLYFQFNEEGVLEGFSSSGWDNISTKWLNSLNEEMVKEYKKEAAKYHDNEIDVMQEVNNQSNALLNIPQAMANEFISLHKNGNIINFIIYLLRITE